MGRPDQSFWSAASSRAQRWAGSIQAGGWWRLPATMKPRTAIEALSRTGAPEAPGATTLSMLTR